MKLRDTLEDIQRLALDTQIRITRIEVDLNHHIRRTELLEKQFDLYHKEFKPVRRHVDFIQGLTKAVAWIVAVSAGAAAITRLFIP